MSKDRARRGVEEILIEAPAALMASSPSELYEGHDAWRAALMPYRTRFTPVVDSKPTDRVAQIVALLSFLALGAAARFVGPGAMLAVAAVSAIWLVTRVVRRGAQPAARP